MITSLINEAKILWAVEPKNHTGAVATSKWVCLKDYQRMYILITTGAIVGAVAAVTLAQATAVAGTGSKTLAFTGYYHDKTTPGTLVKATCSSTFALDTANTMYVIELDPSLTDHTNAFDCVTIAVGSPGVADDFYGVTYILVGNRFSDPTPPSALID